MQLANVYYAVAHVPALIIFLVWLFALHRPRYPAIRNALALTTGACLLIQLIPLAPPRLLPELGVLDTPLLYHQSVYGAHRHRRGGAAVGHALRPRRLGAASSASARSWSARSRWRWLVLAHPVLTTWVVVVTGNHFWLDGVGGRGAPRPRLPGAALEPGDGAEDVGGRTPSDAGAVPADPVQLPVGPIGAEPFRPGTARAC